MAIVGATLWGIGVVLSFIICIITILRSGYHLSSRKPNVQPVSWALVLQHFVSLICFLFGLLLAWQSDEPAVQPLVPYAVSLAALCLAAQLTLMLLQAHRSHPN